MSELKQARLALGYTQAEAASKASVSVRTWIRWEKGHSRVPGAVLSLFKILASSKAG